MEKMKKPQAVDIALNALIDNGYEAYIVGGAVRDYLLGLPPEDFDIVTSATIEEIEKVFKEYKIIETGLKHGTVVLRINKMNIEITTYRNGVNTLSEDLLLRDFTINSLAYSINDEIIDYTNGVSDIRAKIIRINNNSEEIFVSDPLRILRALRLASKYSFFIDLITKNYIFKHYKLLKNISVERITAEFNQLLLTNDFPEIMIEYFDVFIVFIPELAELKGFKQYNKYHVYDCFVHTIEVVKNTDNNLILKLAALFHDIGKPVTFTLDKNGVGHFYGHPEISVDITKKLFKRLKYDTITTNLVLKLIKYHDYPLKYEKKQLKKFIDEIGLNELYLLLQLKEADIKGQNPFYIDRLNEIERIRFSIKEIEINREYISIKQLSINGGDLIDIGFEQNKLIGEILTVLHKEVLEERLPNDRYLLLIEAEKRLNYIKSKNEDKQK